MIVRSRLVVSLVTEPIDNGAVAIDGNKIVGVGRFEEVREQHPDWDVLDLGDQILLPGLINAHCHLDYTLLRGRIATQRTFTDWVCAINEVKAGLTEQDYLQGIAAGLREAQRFGTTTIVNLEAFPELLPQLSASPLRVWWCAEMIDVRTKFPVRRVWENLDYWFRSSPEFLGGLGLAPHALYTASPQLFAESAALGRERGLLLTTHLAESREELQMFRDGDGPLFEFLQNVGRPMKDCGNETPISRLISMQALDTRWIVAHLNEITASDFDLLKSRDRFHLVHCPASHRFFGHSPFPLRRLQKMGFNICLGTDSLASNSSLSLFAEMRRLIEDNQSVTPREAVLMTTINGARAIGRADSLGQIRPGFYADLIALPTRQPRGDLYEAIASYEGETPWIMVNGCVLGKK